MAKEEKLFCVECELTDADYEEVYRVFLDHERGNEKKVALVTCIVLCIICIVLTFVLNNMTFLVYGAGCLIIGLSYFLVPVNKKFLAANQLQFGEKRLLTFYPHAIATVEILEDDDPLEMAENAPEDAVTTVSTVSVHAYETKRCFIFAESNLTNLFFCVPKRGQSEEAIEQLREFAEKRCSGGFVSLTESDRTVSILGETEEKPEEAEENEDEQGSALTSQVAAQFYGAKKLRLHGDDGHRIDLDGDEVEDGEDPEAEDAEPDSSAPVPPPPLDVDAEMAKILGEDSDSDTEETEKENEDD